MPRIHCPSRLRRVRRPVATTALPLMIIAAVAMLPGSLSGNDDRGGMIAPATADTTGGVYTKAQATQGKALYDVECLVCHGPREFMGTVFERRWLTPPVSGIFAHILNTMPQDTPGSLAPEQVARLVAYILELNGKPAGTTPLPVEMEKLARIRVDTSLAPDPESR